MYIDEIKEKIVAKINDENGLTEADIIQLIIPDIHPEFTKTDIMNFIKNLQSDNRLRVLKYKKQNEECKIMFFSKSTDFIFDKPVIRQSPLPFANGYHNFQTTDSQSDKNIKIIDTIFKDDDEDEDEDDIDIKKPRRLLTRKKNVNIIDFLNTFKNLLVSKPTIQMKDIINVNPHIGVKVLRQIVNDFVVRDIIIKIDEKIPEYYMPPLSLIIRVEELERLYLKPIE